MVTLTVRALGSRSRVHSALFSGVITGTLNATLLQVAIFGSMSVILTPEALKLPLRCPVIHNADSEIADSGKCFKVTEILNGLLYCENPQC